ncbi:hypothetical protein ABZ896_27985 [Streptomyces sp. NPDC047072]
MTTIGYSLAGNWEPNSTEAALAGNWDPNTALVVSPGDRDYVVPSGFQVS